MKLLSQESDRWCITWANGQAVATREHRLHLVEAASEFSFNRLLPFVGTINSAEFGGVPAGRLLFQYSAKRDGEALNIVVTLRESEEHGNAPLPMVNAKTGKTFLLETPRYTERDFADVLPKVVPFPNTDYSLTMCYDVAAESDAT